MNLHKLILTNNACYKAGGIITPKGIMVHSTAANNPYLKRYVGPNDGLLGVNANNNHWNQNTPDGRQVCVHAFIGKLADGSIATYQTLPWNMRGWHCGSGPKGSGNDTHIGFEIAEDALTDAAYFNAVYKEAIDLCAYLCKQYGLTEKNIICHAEGYKLGVASNHGDVLHWWPKFGKNMDTFRGAVKAALVEQEDANMTQETFNKFMDTWQDQNDPLYKTLDDVPSYWRNDASILVKTGAIKGDGVNSLGIRASILKTAIINKRYIDSR
jgi:hypothetical protein